MINLRLYFAWVVALAAVLGSLYFSEIAGFIPCKLCWFQRICMYPNVILLGVAAYRNDRAVAWYVLPLCVIGSLFSVIHLLEQHAGLFKGVCTGGVPCSGMYINWFGFVTIPLLALIAFILIGAALVIDLVRK